MQTKRTVSSRKGNEALIKRYSAAFLWGQLTFWHKQTVRWSMHRRVWCLGKQPIAQCCVDLRRRQLPC